MYSALKMTLYTQICSSCVYWLSPVMHNGPVYAKNNVCKGADHSIHTLKPL